VHEPVIAVVERAVDLVERLVAARGEDDRAC
jgi:hypothetical protein